MCFNVKYIDIPVMFYVLLDLNTQHYIQLPLKRKRDFGSDDMSKGVARARQFLKEFSNLPLDKMDLKEALQQVSQLRDGLKKDAVDSNWLQQFLWGSAYYLILVLWPLYSFVRPKGHHFWYLLSQFWMYRTTKYYLLASVFSIFPPNFGSFVEGKDKLCIKAS